MARPGMMQHPKFRRLVALLAMSPAHVRGHLECLWDVAYQCGKAEIGDAVDVELAAGWAGEPGVLCAALLTCGGNGSVGFIERVTLVTAVTECDGEASHPGQERHVGGADTPSPRAVSVADLPVRYRIHDLFDHAPEYVTGRAHRETERQKEKKCSWCGAVYHSADQRSRTCSHACRTAVWREKHQEPVTDGDGVERHGDGVRRSVTSRDSSPAPAPYTSDSAKTGTTKTGATAPPAPGASELELTPPAPTPERRKPKGKPPNPDLKRLLDAAVVACQEFRGFKPVIRGAPEAQAMAMLLAGRTFDQALELVREFYRDPPDWNRDQGTLNPSHIPVAATKILSRLARTGRRATAGGEGRDFAARSPDFVMGDDDDGSDQVQPR